MDDGAERGVRAALEVGRDGSDEAVFAALLLLSRHVPPSAFRAERARIVHGIPQVPAFVARLLVSGEAYRALAATLLAAFCAPNGSDDAVPALFAPCLPGLVSLAREGTASDELDPVEQLQCALHIARASGRGSVPAEARETLVAMACDADADADAADKDAASCPLLAVKLLACADGVTMEQLAALAERCASRPGFFRSVVEVAHGVLPGAEDSTLVRRVGKTASAPERAARALADGVFSGFNSWLKLDSAHRTDVLRLAALLCENVGPGWVTAVDAEAKTKAPLFLRLLAVEMSALLTAMRYEHLDPESSGAQGDAEDAAGDVGGEPVQALLACFRALELAVAFLTGQYKQHARVEAELHWENLPADSLLACRQALVEGFQAITQFVCLTRGSAGEARDSECVRLLRRACARCLACWLADGPDASIGQVEKAELGVSEASSGMDTLFYLATLPDCCAEVVSAVNAQLLEPDVSPFVDGIMRERRASLLPAVLHATAAVAPAAATPGGSSLRAECRLLDAVLVLIELDLDGALQEGVVTRDVLSAEDQAVLRQSFAARRQADAPADVEHCFFALQVDASLAYILALLASAPPGTAAVLEQAAQLQAHSDELASTVVPALRSLLLRLGLSAA